MNLLLCLKHLKGTIKAKEGMLSYTSHVRCHYDDLVFHMFNVKLLKQLHINHPSVTFMYTEAKIHFANTSKKEEKVRQL